MIQSLIHKTLVVGSAFLLCQSVMATDKPNIIVIMADDI